MELLLVLAEYCVVNAVVNGDAEVVLVAVVDALTSPDVVSELSVDVLLAELKVEEAISVAIEVTILTAPSVKTAVALLQSQSV